jgi:hypothetical protein
MRKTNGQTFLFDTIRKKWLLLTPEEWVRQHVLNYLISVKHYSPATIAIEKMLELNGLKKRYDIVVYDAEKKPFLIVECKAPYVALDHLVIAQAQRYNLTIKAELLMISNGISDLVFNAANQVVELPERQKNGA